MPVILHIETATQSCSVAISSGHEILDIRESHINKSHATLLTVFIEEMLRELRISPAELDAIAVSKGPGSYTGLRIGVSTAKGLAYGSGIPLIAVNTLECMARGILPGLHEYLDRVPTQYFLCPMIDARRMEVYLMILDNSFQKIRDTAAEIVTEDAFHDVLAKGPVVFFGSGAFKCREVIHHPNALFIEGFQNSAGHMIPLVLDRYREKLFENVAYFEPYYLKDFVATKPRNKLLGS